MLEAFSKVPRHLFVPKEFEHKAYLDLSLPIGKGQTISAPSTMAFMLQNINIIQTDKVLEIGTGSGFQTALLTKLGKEIFSIERNLELVKEVEKKLVAANCGVAHLRAGDGMLGWSEHAPYDAIIVSAGASEIPNALIDQLKIGGRIVIPLKGKINLIIKSSHGVRIRELADCNFVPLLPGHTK